MSLLLSILSCPQVCYYRDKNSINKFTLARVTKDGVTISGAPALAACLRRLATSLQHHRMRNPPPSPTGHTAPRLT